MPTDDATDVLIRKALPAGASAPPSPVKDSLAGLAEANFQHGALAAYLEVARWLIAEGEGELADLALRLSPPPRDAAASRRTDGIITFRTPRATMAWRAYWEATPRTGFIGMGDTEEAAVADLREGSQEPRGIV